jgi:DNA polymerase delta subunit 1
MIDRGIVGGSWIQVDPGKYRITPPERRTSTCQLEIDVAYL